MDKVHIESFAFEAGVDYQPYYHKLTFVYDSSRNEPWRLKDLLAFLCDEIRNYGCKKENIGLRINGIAVFENLEITSLVGRFGEDWVIEPLSTFYAKKDLLLDTEILSARYKDFFHEADFLSSEEQGELENYLPLNLIAPQYAQSSLDSITSSYLGDGFFLYLKWLLSRHPQALKTIAKWLLHKQKGIWYFVPLAEHVYPRATALDEEIWGLMSAFALGDKNSYNKLSQTLKAHI